MQKSFSTILALVAALLLTLAEPVQAQEDGQAGANRIGSNSGLRLPRFVSLKSSRVNVRKGPSLEHPVAWEYKRIGLPVEVIGESENWRRVRDSEGAEGWVFHSLLSGRRTALVSPWAKSGETVPLYSRPSALGSVMARLEPGVLGSILSCDGNWCQFSLDSVTGWIEQVKLWGVYENEEIE